MSHRFYAPIYGQVAAAVRSESDKVRLTQKVNRLPVDLSRKRLSSITTPHQVPINHRPLSTARGQWEELKEQAIFAFESGLLPLSVDSRQKAIAIALMGKELGLTPMQSLCGLYVVNGRIALRGSLMLRLIYERVNGAAITILTPPERADVECTVEMQRPNGKPHSFRYGVEDAKKAGFMNKPIWQQHTSTMLRWAAIRTGARIVFADAIAGCYMEDEIPSENLVMGKNIDLELPSVPAIRNEGSSTVKQTNETKENGDFSQAASAALSHGSAARVYSEIQNSSEPERKRIQVRDLPLAKPITEKQVSRLYAIAHGKGWNRQEVGISIEKGFKKRDPRDLTRTEYDKLCNSLLSASCRNHGFENQAS